MLFFLRHSFIKTHSLSDLLIMYASNEDEDWVYLNHNTTLNNEVRNDIDLFYSIIRLNVIPDTIRIDE